MEADDLIARFMGTEIKMDMMGNEVPDYKSWNELMEVVIEIESTKAVVTIESTTCGICHSDFVLHGEESIYIDEPAMTKFESIYRAVVEYIKLYNKINNING